MTMNVPENEDALARLRTLANSSFPVPCLFETLNDPASNAAFEFEAAEIDVSKNTILVKGAANDKLSLHLWFVEAELVEVDGGITRPRALVERKLTSVPAVLLTSPDNWRCFFFDITADGSA